MSRILKYRKRKVELSQQGMSTMEQENEKASSSYQTLLFSGFSHSASLFDDSLKQVDSWLSQMVTKSNRAQLSHTNKNYVYSLGEKALSNQLALSHPFAALPEKLLISSLLGGPLFFPKTSGKTPAAGEAKERGAQLKSQQPIADQKEKEKAKRESAGKKKTRRNSAQPSQPSQPSSNQAEKPVAAGSTGKGEKGKKRADKKKQ